MKHIPLFALLVPGVAFACGDLSAHRVEQVSFQKLAADKAVAEVLKGTPYKVVFSGEVPTKDVSASGVSGPLDQVFSSLAAHFGMAYTQDGCTLTLSPKEARVFRLGAGDMIHERLNEWLLRNGYSLTWEATKIRAGAALVIDKPLDELLKEIASIMRANDVRLDIQIYANRMVRVTEVQ